MAKKDHVLLNLRCYWCEKHHYHVYYSERKKCCQLYHVQFLLISVTITWKNNVLELNSSLRVQSTLMQRKSVVWNMLLDLCNEYLSQFINIISVKFLYLRALPSFIAKRYDRTTVCNYLYCINTTEMNRDSRWDLRMENSKWTLEQWESCQVNPHGTLRLGPTSTKTYVIYS